MRESSYYNEQYNRCKSEVKDCEKNIKLLLKVKDRLTNDFYDEQGNVNKELDDLKEDLDKSVRHDAKFSSTASACYTYKEKSTTADSYLNNVVIALENEIATLKRKKETAEQNRDENYKNYKTKKEEERAEMFSGLGF